MMGIILLYLQVVNVNIFSFFLLYIDNDEGVGNEHYFFEDINLAPDCTSDYCLDCECCRFCSAVINREGGEL